MPQTKTRKGNIGKSFSEVSVISEVSEFSTWPSFECHIMQSVKEAITKIGVDQVIIPGGCAKYVQAPGVCWNKPFKELVTE